MGSTIPPCTCALRGGAGGGGEVSEMLPDEGSYVKVAKLSIG